MKPLWIGAVRWCLAGLGAVLATASLSAVEFQPAEGGLKSEDATWARATRQPARVLVKEPQYKSGSRALAYVTMAIGDSVDSLICGALDGSSANATDTLYLDANNNGDLTDDGVFPLKKSNPSPGGVLRSDPVKVLAKYFSGMERNVRVILCVSPVQDERGNLERFYGWTMADHMEGRIDIGKTSVLVGLYDAPGERKGPNGCFGDMGIDHLRIDLNRDGKLDDPAEDFILSKVFGFDGKLWNIRTDSEAGDISVSPCELLTGNILVKVQLTQGRLTRGTARITASEGYQFACELVKGQTVLVPEGAYRLASTDCVATDAAGQTWSFGFGSKNSIVVSAASTTATIGAPIKVEPQLSGILKRGKTITVSTRITGASGEEYTAFACNGQPRTPHVRITNGQGTAVSEGDMRYG